MSEYIVDTNVWVAASGNASCSAECMLNCLDFLEALKQTSASIVMDLDSQPPGNSVLQELIKNLNEGDYSYDLFWRHFYAHGLICHVKLNYDEEGASLPEGLTINQKDFNGSVLPFEPNDRKWIALYLKHPVNPIYNATDSDWEKAREDLTRHGIKIHQLCSRNHIS